MLILEGLRTHFRSCKLSQGEPQNKSRESIGTGNAKLSETSCAFLPRDIQLDKGRLSSMPYLGDVTARLRPFGHLLSYYSVSV